MENVYPVKVVVASLAGKSWGWYQGWIPISHRVLGCGLWVGDGYPIEKEKNTPLCKLYELRDFKMLCAFPEKIFVVMQVLSETSIMVNCHRTIKEAYDG